MSAAAIAGCATRLLAATTDWPDHDLPERQKARPQIDIAYICSDVIHRPKVGDMGAFRE
jgi:hypothetical protein